MIDADALSRIDIHRILGILPHRYPLVMVDRVTAVVPGASIRGHKCVAYNEPWFQGHFPGRPVMPGVLILESLAQIGGILAYASGDAAASEPAVKEKLMLFLGIDKARFRRMVEPGDRLDLFVEVKQRRQSVWKFQAQASVDGAIAAEAELLASAVERAP